MRRVRTQLEMRSKVERLFVLACQRGAALEVGWSRWGFGLLMFRAEEGGGYYLSINWFGQNGKDHYMESFLKHNGFLVYKG